MDIMVPVMDGMETMRELRKITLGLWLHGCVEGRRGGELA